MVLIERVIVYVIAIKLELQIQIFLNNSKCVPLTQNTIYYYLTDLNILFFIIC